jgi:hypothetical protein
MNAPKPELIHYLPVDGLIARTGVLMYYAVLAYPRSLELQKRELFVEAGKAMLFKGDVARGFDRKLVEPYYRKFKNEKIYGTTKKGFQRIEFRLSAASMAAWMYRDGVQERVDSPMPRGPDGIIESAPNTVTRGVKALLKDKALRIGKPYYEPEAAVSNAMHRIWAASLPVLHLAMSLLEAVSYTRLQHRVALYHLIYSTGWLNPALLRAERYRSILPRKIPAFLPESAVCLMPAHADSNTYKHLGFAI